MKMEPNSRNIDFSEEVAFDEIRQPVDNHASVEEETTTTTSENEDNKKIRFREIMNGTFLVRENMRRQLPFVLFLTFLGIIYIGNRFHAERMVRKIDELKIEVGNLRSEQITITSELMNISRPSQVIELVQSRGLNLKESIEPPKKLKK
jgi:Bacteriodetes cell division protein (FtsL-like)